ncbi:MAG: TlpA family protein disulfide reductase [Candidatus Sumerlaeia bacterium]|nr:TlpA family protein disulfide reductase [Candidatus Sumerlaeia bacterium]
MKRTHAVAALVSAGVLLVSAVAVGAASEAKKAGTNAFQSFRAGEMKQFVQFRSELLKGQTSEEELMKKFRDYGAKMIERYEKFGASPEGAPHAMDVKKEVIMIAVQLLEDGKKVKAVIAAEKNPDNAIALKMHAAKLCAQSDMDKEAKELVDALLEDAKGKPELEKEVETLRFQIAPQGLPFPEFAEGTNDLDGKPIRIADYKDKVVLVDFWAAWCGPCMAEAPNVVKAYEKYHPKGFEIIGISLDDSKDKMLAAMKEKGMTWRQYFDGLGWKSKVGTRYGIHAIPATYLVGPDGKILANNVRGKRLEEELEKALGKK